MRSPRVVAIVPSAGCGKRLGARTKKPFVMLGGRPLVSHALKTLNECKGVDGIIVASEKDCVKRLKDIARRSKISKLIDVVVGGATRFESVRNCMKRVDASFDIVIIHDLSLIHISEPTRPY